MAKKIVPTEPAKPEAKSAPAKKTTKSKTKVAEKEAAPAKSKTVKKKKDEVAALAGLKAVEPYSRFTDFDVALFKSGKHFKLYEKFGSHVIEFNGVVGTYFAVWAPNAQYISVIGNFNYWDRGTHPLYVRWDGSGIWEGFIPNVGNDETYKYYIKSSTGEDLEKSDPFALRWEVAPRTASLVADTYHEWKDGDWMASRYGHNALNRPYSVYEMHVGSWARSPESPDEFLTYEQLAGTLVPYIKEMGFTHVEFMPIMEHPFYPSWGYQITGFFAASSRYGTPKQLMYLIEQLHLAGIGVILDWVPSHFPGDAHGLYNFDGTHLYEHADVRKGFHPDWKSYIFNYGRNEVRSFLISNALFWLDRYHVDGLRVDAVASMLYLDYSRKHGEWEPNIYGGNENLEAVSFLKEFNEAVYSHFPDTQTIAEESTSFTGVSRPVYLGGLGFGMKWMMGWMHDSIKYFSKDPVYRKYHHNQITFSLIYAFTENFMLPFSHDEVVYGKGSMVNKMPGDEWQKFANLRLLYSYMFTHPGTKLLFMGAEFGQGNEWNFQQSLDWHVLQYPNHQGIKETVKALNHLYRSEPALYEKGFDWSSFEWIDGGNANDSILIYNRKGHDTDNELIIVLNMTPTPHYNYRVGVPFTGEWKEIFNSDAEKFWGGGITNNGLLHTETVNWHGKENSINITIPPLAAVVFKRITNIPAKYELK
ncbi:1,4-alpha-glucan branching protein GlgB [Mucilaginibacter sp. X4EP1]|uniref:1,4-alpha-glucan branching protein GlgB n=1 Tax=Mucilaginibacter sp. X4EP1 TaxID=2723092 RepID=UPI002166D7CD|nr:1,4-alpha-glucan branching protein GlgB [Mucilaginibacter sp. X4EP1]MCS3812345.1 1,4-alpha-glucan branching enzyme [Mucilaginibacter sp. X4EP1]